MFVRTCMLIVLFVICSGQIGFAGQEQYQNSNASNGTFEYRLLATNKTSTMEKELNEAAEEGYRFEGVMGGGTAFGGDEAVVIMSRVQSDSKSLFEYKLLATNKTSTMQKEMQQAADRGFMYKGQTVFDTTFGGKEVVVIMERDKNAKPVTYEYKLLATKRTSTMQKELSEAGREGFAFLGITVAKTAFGGEEVVVITGRPRANR